MLTKDHELYEHVYYSMYMYVITTAIRINPVTNYYSSPDHAVSVSHYFSFDIILC